LLNFLWFCFERIIGNVFANSKLLTKIAVVAYRTLLRFMHSVSILRNFVGGG